MDCDTAFDLLKHAFRHGRTAHAYLLAGAPRGAAGDLAVRVLQLVACAQPDGPCGMCDACRQVREHTWPDSIWIQPEKKSRVIAIKQIREELLPRIDQTSFGGGWKAAVLLGADRLTEEAANAFLKTLEEPPPQTLFLLLSDSPQFLLPTVLSRCQRLDVSDRAPKLSEAWRTRVLDVLAGPAWTGPTGAMAAAGRVQAVLAEVLEDAEAKVAAEAEAETDLVDEDDAVYAARVSARYRESRMGVLECLLGWYRDLLVLRSGGAPELVANAAYLTVLQARAAKLTLAQALANVDGIEELNRQLDRSLPEPSLLAYWLDRLASGA